MDSSYLTQKVVGGQPLPLKFALKVTHSPFKRVPGLSRGVVCVILRLSVLIQYRRVTDTHTGRLSLLPSVGR